MFRKTLVPSSSTVGYLNFGGPYFLHPWRWSSKVLWNISILPQHYTSSHLRRPLDFDL